MRTPTRIIKKPYVVGAGSNHQLILPTDAGEMSVSMAAELTGIKFQTLYSRVAYDDDRWGSPHVFHGGRLYRPSQQATVSVPLVNVEDAPPEAPIEKKASKKDWRPWLDEYKMALRKHMGLDR